MPQTEKTCITCEKVFLTKRANHKNRNPIFCSPDCIRTRAQKGDPRFKWRVGKGFWQTATEQQKIEKLKELYEKNVIKNNEGCWGWKSVLLNNGYAKLGMGIGKSISAHRASWIINNGPINDNLHVLHKCDRRDCTKIEHLFLGDLNDNMRDMVSKGRQMHGVKHYCARLDESKVREIKKIIKSGVNCYTISKMFNVNSGTIQNIMVGRTWKHVKDEE